MRRLSPLLAVLLQAGDRGLAAPPDAHTLSGRRPRLSRRDAGRLPGIGHGVPDSDARAVTLARRFLAKPRRAPRADCMDNLSPVQFAP